jgi:hypothetical protein
VFLKGNGAPLKVGLLFTAFNARSSGSSAADDTCRKVRWGKPLITREKLLPPGDFLFGGKFGVGETRLMRHAQSLSCLLPGVATKSKQMD